jgi:predicted CoA-substrate-specific enzyme activase
MLDIDDALDDYYKGQLRQARTVGIDIGSRGAKGVLLYEGKLYTSLQSSGVSSIETGKELLYDLVQQAEISESDVNYIVGTGYGRVAMEFGSIPFAGVTEITCHGTGAHYLHHDTTTILDIGGQDSKAIRIRPEDGSVVEFVMNDKCAAGTGRFLEKVANMLNLTITELGEFASKSDNPIQISSQCVVFAESEVISLKAHNAAREDIAAGIHLATARRVKYLLKRVGLEDDILFTGGVSKNVGMRKAVETVLDTTLATTKLDATFAGALGAAIHANEFHEGVESSFYGGL